MIKASEIRKKVEKRNAELKQAEVLKMKQNQINSELLEVEKALNEFNRYIDKDNFDVDIKYITVPIWLCKDVKNILENEGYCVKSVIGKRETHLYFNNEQWKGTLDVGDAIAVPCKTESLTLNTNANNLKTKLHNKEVENECMVTKDDKEKAIKELVDTFIKEYRDFWRL
jgi:hypothetical protein